MIEHTGIVKKLADGRVTVAMSTAGCGGCGHAGGCGVGKMAAGRPATLLELSAPEGLRVGDAVTVMLPEGRLPLMALFGYFFPALAMLLGAGVGNGMGGDDSVTALGAMIGFLSALVIARLALGCLPGLTTEPQIRPVQTSFVSVSNLLNPESYHER